MENAKITKELEESYQSQGLIRIQQHPFLDLKIINYTEKVIYENLWDENLLKYRALVYNSNYEIVAKSFDRFFNIEENRHEPTDDFEVYEKLDGQLILCFWYNGEMTVASRGSFTSKYAIEAKRILDEKYPEFERTTKQNSYQTTYCFELIGFEQIVVSYPEPDLILTGCFYKSKHEGWIDSDIYNICKRPFNDWPRLVKKYSGLDYKNIKQLNWQNAEGFVVRFSNGDRCKIKFEDYLKLHRQMTNLSTTAIWEALKDGKPVSSILSDVPDEFYQKVHAYETELKRQYMSIRIDCEGDFIRLGERAFDKKTFAGLVKNHPQKGIIFSMYDGKDYSQLIWKMIKPKFEKI